MAKIKDFRGLNNVTDPMRLGVQWLVTADNIDITATGAIVKRSGYSLSKSGNYSSAFSTADYSRLYLAIGNTIQTLDGTVVASILDANATMYWTQVNEQVFYSNGIDSGIINQDNSVIDWRWEIPSTPELGAVTGNVDQGSYQVLVTYALPDGRETGACDPISIGLTSGQALQITSIPQIAGCATNIYIAPANSTVFSLFKTTLQTSATWNFSPDNLGRDFTNDQLDPLPLGVESIQAWRGRVYASDYQSDADQTVIWYSQPLGFHLFNLNTDFFIVPGHVHMLAPTDTALVIGTQARVYAYGDNKLDQIADYGVVPGHHWARDDERILFWSLRGVCSAMPFANLTEKNVSVAPGVRAGGCLVRSGGQKRYLGVVQQGGTAFNSY